MDNEQLIPSNVPTVLDAFADKDKFELAQRVAKVFSAGDLVPARFKNNIPNTMIALEMANRFKASPIFIMQNLYVVHGTPAWSGQFVIASINSCGKFREDIDFEFTGTEDTDDWSCRAYTTNKAGKEKKGAKVSIKMAKAEGWFEKSGSKWKTMPEQMLMYRAASFFGRIHCPEVLMGIYTVEEVEDYTVLSDLPMENWILKLIETSTLDEDQRDILREKVDNELTFDEGQAIISHLKDNQLDPATQGKNISATQAKYAAKR